MVDIGMTVKGLFALATIHEEEATRLEWGNDHDSRIGNKQADVERQAAARCRSKAYDLLGVVTLNADSRSTQRALDEVQL